MAAVPSTSLALYVSLVCDLTSSSCSNLSHHLPKAAAACPCHWNPIPVADLCFVIPLLIRMGLTMQSSGAVKIGAAVEMSELAEAGVGLGGHCLPPQWG